MPNDIPQVGPLNEGAQYITYTSKLGGAAFIIDTRKEKNPRLRGRDLERPIVPPSKIALARCHEGSSGKLKSMMVGRSLWRAASRII